MGQKVKVARVGQVEPGRSIFCQAGPLEIALHFAGGAYYATEPFCPHRGGSLAEGFQDGTQLMCKLHGWQFDLTTGSSTNIPGVKIGTYPVTVEGEDIFVELPTGDPAP